LNGILSRIRIRKQSKIPLNLPFKKGDFFYVYQNFARKP
jgi:hypothetical protein